jgi:2,5-furandicarboxylate decarboxylase 1
VASQPSAKCRSTFDTRWFIGVLRERDLLIDVHREVDPVHELGAVLRASEQSGTAALFHNVRGHSIPVFGSALGSNERIAVALECEPSEVGSSVQRALSTPIPPAAFDAPAPSQETVTTDVDLGRLPVPIHAPGDAGNYINAGVVIGRDPDSGRHNLSYVRLQVRGPARTGVNINAWRDLREFLDRAEERGENLAFCVAIGVDPVLMMAAAFRSPGDEYEIAGGLRGAPVPVVRATSCDVLVPAFAEIILECEIVAGERLMEGPMAEFTGHYSGSSPQPVGVVKAITHRREPIFQTIAGASWEHLVVGNALTREPHLESAVRRISPRVRAVHLPPYGSGFTAFVSLEDPRPGEAQNVGIAALHSHVNVKAVVVVDSDVDIFNPTDVLWALSTRVRWATSLNVLTGASGNELDPSSDELGLVDKAIIDATLGERAGSYTKVNYPAVNLNDYL